MSLLVVFDFSFNHNMCSNLQLNVSEKEILIKQGGEWKQLASANIHKYTYMQLTHIKWGVEVWPWGMNMD